MSGIAKILAKREAVNSPNEQSFGREIWFKDGDQAFLSPVASGEEGDRLLDELYLYTYRSGNRWINLLSEDGIDTSSVPSDTRPAHKVAFWAFVHEIIHPEKKMEDWEEVQGPSAKKMYKQTINDFKVIPLGFGRSDYIWNQLVDIYNDWGALNKGVIRVKRTGAGMYDTSYTIAATTRSSDLTEDQKAEIKDLPSIKEYYKERYGKTPDDVTEAANAFSTDDTEDDLF